MSSASKPTCCSAAAHLKYVVHATLEAVVGIRVIVNPNKQSTPRRASRNRSGGELLSSIFSNGNRFRLGPWIRGLLQKNARSRQSGDLTLDFVLCVPVKDVFDRVMVSHTRKLEGSLDGLEIVGINRKRNHEHIVVLVKQVVTTLVQPPFPSGRQKDCAARLGRSGNRR